MKLVRRIEGFAGIYEGERLVGYMLLTACLTFGAFLGFITRAFV